MGTTDLERQQAHNLAKRQWDTLAAKTRVLTAQPVSPLPQAGAPLVEPVPEPPAPPAAPDVRVLAARLFSQIPWWARGERRVARRLAGEQAAQLAERQAQAYERACGLHREAVDAVGLRNEKHRRDHATEQRLLTLLRDRLEAGDDAVVAFSTARLAASLAFRVHLHLERGRAIVLVPALDIEDVPERVATETAAGKPTTRKLNKGERNAALAESIAARTTGAATVIAAGMPAATEVHLAAVDRSGGGVGSLKVPAGRLESSPERTLRRQFEASIKRRGAAGNLVAEAIAGLNTESVAAAAALAT